jgi:cell division protein ZapA
VKEKIHTLTVSILDKDYQVACPPDQQAELIDAARYLDEQMRKIRGNGKVVGIERIAVMAALNISHELRTRSKTAESSTVSTEQVKRLNTKVDSALARMQQLDL